MLANILATFMVLQFVVYVSIDASARAMNEEIYSWVFWLSLVFGTFVIWRVWS